MSYMSTTTDVSNDDAVRFINKTHYTTNYNKSTDKYENVPAYHFELSAFAYFFDNSDTPNDDLETFESGVSLEYIPAGLIKKATCEFHDCQIEIPSTEPVIYFAEYMLESLHCFSHLNSYVRNLMLSKIPTE
jgi:hypothetical protein